MEKVVKFDVVVRKDFPLRKGEPVADAMKKLRTEGANHLRNSLSLKEDKWGLYMVEAFSTAAVYEAYPFKGDSTDKVKFFALAFKRDGEGKFEFGASQEVERVTSFQPVSPKVPTLKTLSGWKPSEFWHGTL